MICCLFTLIFYGRVPVSPLIPYNIKFVQRGFTERVALEERIPRAGRGLTVLSTVLMLQSLFHPRSLNKIAKLEIIVCVSRDWYPTCDNSSSTVTIQNTFTHSTSTLKLLHIRINLTHCHITQLLQWSDPSRMFLCHYIITRACHWTQGSRVQTRPRTMDFRGDKIRSTPSFGGEVKPSVPCRRFTACKRTLRAR
jgi:hypothetical protein